MGFLARVQRAYSQDPLLKKVLATLDSGERVTHFRKVGNLLWRVAEGLFQLVIPDDMGLKELIMRECHDVRSAGHLGRRKTLEKVQRRFWWNGLTRDVEEWVKTCHECQESKSKGRAQPSGELHPLGIPHRCWEVVSMDFVTGLPPTVDGLDAILTFTDKLSKMVHLVPLNFAESSAEQVARIYMDWVWRLHGAPRKIISDRDVRFQSQFWLELH
jgi:hypothetical protein